MTPNPSVEASSNGGPPRPPSGLLCQPPAVRALSAPALLLGPRARLRGWIHVNGHEWRTNMVPRNTICLWYDGTALDAATFYAKTFPDSKVGKVYRAPGDYPSGKQGEILTVEFTVVGIPCVGLNGGPAFKHTE